MDRTGTAYRGEQRQERVGPPADFVLPSRAAALAVVRGAVEAMAGPVLLTGESGVGKTWLCRQLPSEMSGVYRWLTLDLTPALGPAGLYRLVLRGLGLGPSDTAEPAAARLALEDALLVDASDGVRWILVVDEAQNASDTLLEELRILSNRLGEPGGFAGILLLGQNVLLRRLEHRSLHALASRIATHVHLRPLELEELRQSLLRIDPARFRDALVVERLHRDVAGNPRRAFRLSRPELLAPAPVAAPPELSGHHDDEPYEEARLESEVRPPVDLSNAVPARPPLQVGEGVIEVGWDESTSPEDEGEEADSLPEITRREEALGVAAQPGGPVDEFVEDRYAAIQAWNEWAGRQPRVETETVGVIVPVPERAESLATHLVDAPEPTKPLADVEFGHANPGAAEVRAETQHGFAPYSQLFSRLRQPHDSA